MQVGAPFTQLPPETNLIIATMLPREDCIKLRLINKESKMFINKSDLLKKYDAFPLKPIPMQEA